MWRVEKPDMDVGSTFITCISRVRDSKTKSQLESILTEIKEAEKDYVDKAEKGKLHLIPPKDNMGSVFREELIKTYTQRMVPKEQPGRAIYNRIKLLPEDDRCPFCDHRNVSTVDHILPKKHYPIFSVTPVNLVGCCSECNKLKLDIKPTTAFDSVLHPYFDEVTNQQWLKATIIEQIPPALTFSAIKVDVWDEALNARLAHQFNYLKLSDLYSNQAAREITDIRQNLKRHFNSGGSHSVRSELKYQWESRQANRINSWQTATYEALAKSDWFCTEGFSKY